MRLDSGSSLCSHSLPHGCPDSLPCHASSWVPNFPSQLHEGMLKCQLCFTGEKAFPKVIYIQQSNFSLWVPILNALLPIPMCVCGFPSTPLSSSWRPAGFPTVELDSDTIYLEIVSGLYTLGACPTRLLSLQMSIMSPGWSLCVPENQL